MPKTGMHGLSLFISDIRNCKCKEAEIMRINKELANIRSKFKKENLLNGYNKKKYICKLIFIFLLGYDFDCGHEESVNLLSSNKFSEKHIGYLFISVVMNEKSNLMKLVLKCVENDLESFNSDNQVLALNYVANMANVEMAEAVGEQVLRLLFSGEATNSVKQSAVLCLLRLFRLKPDIISKKEYVGRITSFLTDPDLGVLTASLSLIEALAAASKLNQDNCFHSAVHRLHRIMKYPSLDLQDYNYYFVQAPWLSVKLLKLLQYLPFPVEPSSTKNYLIESIEFIFNKVHEPPKTKKIEHRNCRNAVMFEAINYIYHVNTEYSLQMRACNILDMNLKQNDSNLRYLALETMQLLTKSAVCSDRIKQQLKPIADSLKYENDICIRQKAANLLYNLCDRSNIIEVIEQMFEYLEDCDMTVKKEVVLKIAVLAENYLCDLKCYVDVILKLLKFYGEYVTTAVWYRFIQLVTNNKEVRGYAAKTLFDALQTQPFYDTFVAVAAYVLGEFGNLIAGDERSNPNIQLRLLHSNFAFCSKETKAMLLTTYIKFFNLFPDIKENVKLAFLSYMKDSDAEIQQRAVEYSKLCEVVNRDSLAAILDEMPCFKNKIFSVETTLQNLKTKFTELSLKKQSKNEKKEDSFERSISYNEAIQHYSISKPNDNDAFPVRSLTVPQNVYMPKNYYDTLVEVFIYSSSNQTYSRPGSQSTSTLIVTSNEEAIQNLIWHENGVLYESNILLIHVESEFRKYGGFIHLKYKNKTFQVIESFVSFFPNDNDDSKLQLRTKPNSTTIPANEEIIQDVEVECIQDFTRRPVLCLNFFCEGLHQRLDLQLPVTLNKFIEPITLTYDQFFTKWNSMQHCKEYAAIFPAKYIMNKDLLRTKLNGLGLNILENIDKNLDNFVCAGIFYSRSLPAGILLRLECNFPNFMYHLTIRSIKESVSEEILQLAQRLL
ncbi:AP-2 complex subunit alpha-2 [Araneus ventricosus]|uniref:AP-2 complex subunit alpha n=1 Tax=Araneus ventricosus TaxID=182803 RepID=A0A4Y2C6S7_ARAVE|nr:AP-2 complex subunit alpha-2 [Araneus ventricosus]